MTLLRLCAVALIAAFAFGGVARASTVDYTGTQYDAGTVSAGQSGTISTTTSTQNGITMHDLLSGYLPADSEIIFTYTLPSTLQADTSLYAYAAQGQHNASATATVTQGHGSSVSSSSNSLIVLASANFDSKKSGTTTIINNSSTAAFFSSVLESAANYKNLIVTYTVQSLAAVPLPGSMVLFAAALVALFGFAYRQKARSVA
ncbi:MAG: hypothetical protein KGI37_04445 [Alphaproteobacteria bacterium]|nr:hypothetical protein [Alphaproteobacteria bacterium]